MSATATPDTKPPSDKPEDIKNAVIRLAGDSQDGIQSIGGFLARLAGRSAQEVMTYMTIPSTISGGASIFQVHIGSGEVLSAGDEADVLVAFYQHSYDDHLSALRDGGVCLYDSDHVKPDEEDKRVRHVGVPMTSLTVEALGGSSKDRGKNMFCLGQLTKLFSLDRDKLTGIIEHQFAKKPENVLRNVMLAFDSGYAHEIGEIFGSGYEFHPGESLDEHRVTTDGNTALSYGLLAAGVRYGAGYPITPWSSIMETLRSELPKYGGLFVQSEDELAAVSTAIGFAYSGHLSVTGSSGPGLSLKMEALGYASMAELPLIVINVQRGGPSTGLPTSVEQSDLMQAIYGSHGDTPRVVLAPKDVEDCFYIAIEAARIAKIQHAGDHLERSGAVEPDRSIPRAGLRCGRGRAGAGHLDARRRFQAVPAGCADAPRGTGIEDGRRQVPGGDRPGARRVGAPFFEPGTAPEDDDPPAREDQEVGHRAAAA